MEQTGIGNMTFNTCIDFLQQQELIQKYIHDKSLPTEQIFIDTYMLKKIFKMFVLWIWTWKKRENAQHLGRLVQIALKRTIFKQYENSKRKTLKELQTKQIWKSFQ